MKACIKITDRVGLTDFVAMLGTRALRSEWLAHDVWAVEEGDGGRFEELCGSGNRIGGEDFVRALKPVIQVVDGRFEVFEDGYREPWAVIESIDCSFHLLHADEDVLMAARGRFTDVTNYNPPAVPWRRRGPAEPSSAADAGRG